MNTITQLDHTEERAVRNDPDRSRIGNAGLAVAAVAALCSLLGGRLVDSSAVDGLGLLRALPSLYWVGVALGVAATFLLLRMAARSEGSRSAAAVPMLWLLVLHTAPQLANAHPRSTAAWRHLGILRAIGETGTADVAIDPRLGWPGAYGVLMASVAGLDDGLLESLLRIWPTFITGATTILVAALARRSYPTIPLIGSLSALVYVLLAWTGQDFFSPQSVGLLWFVALVVLLESGPLETSSAWSGTLPPLQWFSASGGDRPASRSTPAFVALIVLSFGAVVSHPMAPLFICVALFLLGLYGRHLAWRLLLFVGVAFLVWFGVSGQPWWSGPGELTRPFAGLLDNTGVELGGSAAEASADHVVVIRFRLSLTVATFAAVILIGVAMGGERLRHLRPAIPLVPLVAVPVLIVSLGGYSGASMIHAIWFTLPFAAVLIARLLAALRVRTLPFAGAIVAAALCPLLLITRFGGERFEFATEPDRTAVLAAYDRADDDTLFVADSNFVPWGDQGVGRNAFTVQPVEASQEWLDRVEAEATATGKSRIVVVLTDGQAGWSLHGRGEPAGTLDEFAEWLLDREGSELLFNDESSWAIEL